MHYVSVEGLGKSYGVKPLFENITFHIEEGDKIALVARNGSGKSTLLRILSGNDTADNGTVWIHKDVTVALFEQEPVFAEDKSILDNIFHHNHPVINAIRDYEAASDSEDVELLTEAIVRLDELNAWDFDTKVKQILGKLNIHHLQQPAGTLSGGQRKRVALAKTLIDIGFEHKHVLLIMDEPTNHLDVEMVEWLEHYLNQEKVTLLLVTHDRYFLDNVSEEIWEMDGSSLHVYKGDYENYLEKKSARIENESASIEKARNTYRKELEWMRKQPKARTTKSKSRQDNFYVVEARAKQRIEDQQVELQMKMNRLGGKIAELKKVYKAYGEKTILKGFDYTFKKGERLGVIGRNGVGKSTFINMLQGLEQPDSGKINIGETVIFGNYSQQGLVIKEDMRVIEFVKNIAEVFPLAAGGSLSAAQFLNLFLFPPEQQYTYISKLSGERKEGCTFCRSSSGIPISWYWTNRPTTWTCPPSPSSKTSSANSRAVCLSSAMTVTLWTVWSTTCWSSKATGLSGTSQCNYTQYRQWQKQGDEQAEFRPVGDGFQSAPPTQQPAAASPAAAPAARRQLSYKEKREFEILEKEIAQLNQEKQDITGKLNSGSAPFDQLQQMSIRIGEIGQLLDDKELRWLELSEIGA
ncbi:ABC-F family ATP-binding cassette domain-containing protein [Puia sp. P3]|uniref:ABC-F family ATP-binding cassette domain-containing protein n=1 Tax=Puia sp. P3 TaxID=3423952 RepID=UPI003D678225